MQKTTLNATIVPVPISRDVFTGIVRLATNGGQIPSQRPQE